VADQPSLQVEIVAPDGAVYADTVSMVVAPGVEGELGILARHEPLVSLLAIGETRVRRLDGDWERFATGIGYLQVLFNKVMLVVDHAEQAGRIDVERAEGARRRAEDRLARRADPEAEAEVDYFRAEMALKRAENRLKVAARA
jgi:F-type H+-transporting ATPase subunit epsilon